MAEKDIKIRLHRTDWRTSATRQLQAAQLTCGPQPSRPDPPPAPPWNLPPPAETLFTEVRKTDPVDTQKRRAEQLRAALGKLDLEIYTDGSTKAGTSDGGAGIVAFREGQEVWRSYLAAGKWCSSYLAERTAMEAALNWLETAPTWTTGAIFCDCYALVRTLGSGSTLDPTILALQRRLSDVGREKRISVVWIPGHCAVWGNELADELAKKASTVLPQDAPLDDVALSHLLRRACAPPPISHPRLAAQYARRPVLKKEDLELTQQESVDLVRFRSGHHPALRRWQHLTGMVDSPACRLCGEEEESATHLWLSCPAFERERLLRNAGRDQKELINPNASAKALLRTILRRLR